MGHCENNPDSDYEKSCLNSLIHVPLVVLLFNSIANNSELRTVLTTHKSGMPLFRFIFESICKHREEHQGKPDVDDPDNEHVLEWFQRLVIKLITNLDTDASESTTSLIAPMLNAMEDNDMLTRKFFSFLTQLCEAHMSKEDPKQIRSLMTTPALVQLFLYGRTLLTRFKARYTEIDTISIYQRYVNEYSKHKLKSKP